ncbi:hypothetical protein ACFL59_08335 [Planctomycetota bacterium]
MSAQDRDSSEDRGGPVWRFAKNILTVAVLVVALYVVIVLTVPGFTENRVAANESSAIATLRVLGGHQDRFFKEDLDRDGKQNYAATFATLNAAIELPVGLTDTGTRSGYRFEMVTTPDRTTFAVEASPVRPGKTGRVHLFIDQTRTLRFEKDRSATRQSPALSPD